MFIIFNSFYHYLLVNFYTKNFDNLSTYLLSVLFFVRYPVFLLIGMNSHIISLIIVDCLFFAAKYTYKKMEMNLIVGKNSSIINEIQHLLKNYEFCSHSKISRYKSSDFDNVIIFSWSNENIDDNYKIIEHFKGSNLVFISSTSIFSLMKRKQWNKYPNWKKEIEDYVIKNNGRVIRIGVWDKENIKGTYGYLPYTSNERLIYELNNINEFKGTIIDCFEIVEGELSLFKKYFAISLNKLTFLLPTLFIFQAPIELLLKLLGIKSYGYTNDSNSFFKKTIMIGRGCLGGEF